MVKGRCEDQVANLLNEKNFRVFLPKGTVTKVWSDRTKIVSVPLFEGYVFCYLDPAQRGYVLCTPGVVSIVGSGGRPLPIAREEMASLHRIMESGIPAAAAELVAGQQVRVIRGPLTGLQGDLVVSQQEFVLTISLTLLSRAVSVKMPRSHVELIAEGTPNRPH